jgi:hypothetical protein
MHLKVPAIRRQGRNSPCAYAPSSTWIWNPEHNLPECFWKVGSNQHGRSRQPRIQAGMMRSMAVSSVRGSSPGAPNNSSGRVVPRPSDKVVPSSITVPA